MRLIGFDPGLLTTGWGVIEAVGNRLSYVADGHVTTSPKAQLSERLVELHAGLVEVIREYAPEEAAVEETFVNKNPVSTLKLGQARGIVLLVPALAGLYVAEYLPNLVKKTVVGSGHAARTGADDGQNPAAGREDYRCRCSRRAGRGDLPCASPRHGRAGPHTGKGRDMIARLKGIVEEIGDDWVVIDVAGVGYLVFALGRTLAMPAGCRRGGNAVYRGRRSTRRSCPPLWPRRCRRAEFTSSC